MGRGDIVRPQFRRPRQWRTEEKEREHTERYRRQFPHGWCEYARDSIRERLPPEVAGGNVREFVGQHRLPMTRLDFLADDKSITTTNPHRTRGPTWLVAHEARRRQRHAFGQTACE